ncbi:MAG: LAGLIDADG family homing endonuclease [Candidatus Omnitrophota bacterium]
MAKVTTAYLQGILGDATYNNFHKTHRISQANREWLERIKNLLFELGYKSWIYKEGSKRNVFVLETTSKILSMNFDPGKLQTYAEKIAYLRGYFDAEGGTSHNDNVRFYLQFAEKNKNRLEKVRNLLEELGIQCGRMHCPSLHVDPNYWRFYIRANSYDRFIEKIGSWHPRKEKIFSKRRRYSPRSVATQG